MFYMMVKHMLINLKNQMFINIIFFTVMNHFWFPIFSVFLKITFFFLSLNNLKHLLQYKIKLFGAGIDAP